MLLHYPLFFPINESISQWLYPMWSLIMQLVSENQSPTSIWCCNHLVVVSNLIPRRRLLVWRDVQHVPWQADAWITTCLVSIECEWLGFDFFSSYSRMLWSNRCQHQLVSDDQTSPISSLSDFESFDCFRSGCFSTAAPVSEITVRSIICWMSTLISFLPILSVGVGRICVDWEQSNIIHHIKYSHAEWKSVRRTY